VPTILWYCLKASINIIGNPATLLSGKKIIANVPYSDSLLSKKEVSNGDAHGYEIMLQKKNDGNISRKRILLNGNKIYSLVTIQPASEINNANNNKFFEDFLFSKPVEATSLFTSKADLLLADLKQH
jgi:hypothetical protein